MSPKYLAPGVYVEEIPFQSRPIAGVSPTHEKLLRRARTLATKLSKRHSGVRLLLIGPSGTGRTTAAQVIANELRFDLYRVDLSALTSKYIGETEKNLRRLFDAAEGSRVV